MTDLTALKTSLNTSTEISQERSFTGPILNTKPMNKYTRLLECSKAINRFAQVERMDQDDIYELFYSCYCSYADMFIERMRNGVNLKRILTEYKQLPEFGILKPSQISRIIFTSRKMAYWFAFMFWQAIDRQVIKGNIDRDELQLELTFIGRIPSAEKMEEILYEQRTKEGTTNLLLSEGYAGNLESQKVSTGIAIDS